MNPRCRRCGLFMSWPEARTTAVVSTPFGGYDDLEPPEEEYCHRACWDAAAEADRDLTRRVSWIPPAAGGVRL